MPYFNKSPKCLRNSKQLMSKNKISLNKISSKKIKKKHYVMIKVNKKNKGHQNRNKVMRKIKKMKK
jgi:hypothetical protein